jgi:hypothetical protein
MENAAWLDWVMGGMAIVILLGGLLMLLRGTSAMGK